MSLYQLHDIRHGYNGRPVLDIDHWHVGGDTIVGLSGPNGSGKSTLLKLLGFIERPRQGDIFFNGERTGPFSQGIRAQVALLPQEAYLLKRSVYANIAFGLRLRKDRRDERRRVDQALEVVGLEPEHFSQRPWFALSGGEAKRVALAARLVLQPRVLLLDEPTTSVDAASAQLIKDAVLQARQKWGSTLIISSHDMDWLQGICDQMLHLFRGRLIGSGQRTLIFGPWQEHSHGRVRRALTDEQDFLAAAPLDANHNAVAAIDPAHIGLYPQVDQIAPAHHGLQGTLLRLSLEKSTPYMSAAIAVGNTIFKAQLTLQAFSSGRFAPGQSVWIGYDPEQVEWQ